VRPRGRQHGWFPTGEHLTSVRELKRVDLQPDIVAIGTPGGAHFEPIMAALAHGCHVYCDKPLAATAVHAKTLYQTAIEAGVKTAYAASYRYMPHVLLAKELVAQGAIGEPLEVECISHFNLNPLRGLIHTTSTTVSTTVSPIPGYGVLDNRRSVIFYNNSVTTTLYIAVIMPTYKTFSSQKT